MSSSKFIQFTRSQSCIQAKPIIQLYFYNNAYFYCICANQNHLEIVKSMGENCEKFQSQSSFSPQPSWQENECEYEESMEEMASVKVSTSYASISRNKEINSNVNYYLNRENFKNKNQIYSPIAKNFTFTNMMNRK